jgi:hypothetical protein
MKTLLALAGVLVLASTALADTPHRVGWQDIIDGKFRGEAPASAATLKKINESAAERDRYLRDKKDRDDSLGQASKAANDLKSKIDKAAGLGSAAKDFLDAYKGLSKEDETMSPDYSPPGMPKVPSRCAASAQCGECYEAAHEDLRKARVNLERLRAAGLATKTLVERGIAFGDNVSGVHGVVGMAWQAEKLKVNEAMRGFNQTYDAKYTELIGGLEKSLQKVGACEAEHYGEDGWYDRYGFIYYTFMSDRYKRWF